MISTIGRCSEHLALGFAEDRENAYNYELKKKIAQVLKRQVSTQHSVVLRDNYYINRFLYIIHKHSLKFSSNPNAPVRT